MYEELIMRLREAPNDWPDADLHYEAADAIEDLSRDLDSMNDANVALYGALPKWIPVTERLPEPGWYLVRCNEMHKHIHRIAYYCDSIWYEDGNNITKFVTHWVRLPEPPKEE